MRSLQDTTKLEEAFEGLQREGTIEQSRTRTAPLLPGSVCGGVLVSGN